MTASQSRHRSAEAAEAMATPRLAYQPHAHRVGTSVLLGWHTERSVDFVVKLVKRLSGEPLSLDEASLLLREEDEDGNDEVEGTSGEILDLVLADPKGVQAANVRFPGVHFAWIRSDDAKSVTANMLAVCNARFEPYRHEVVAELLGATAIDWDDAWLRSVEHQLDTPPTDR
jgi:hypothetical protein